VRAIVWRSCSGLVRRKTVNTLRSATGVLWFVSISLWPTGTSGKLLIKGTWSKVALETQKCNYQWNSHRTVKRQGINEIIFISQTTWIYAVRIIIGIR
jgi:hypothetical protein